MLRLWEGIVRRALSEPSIGSITTRAAPPAPKATSPRSSETATKEAPAAASCLELGEDHVLAAAVDLQGAVAALADPLVDGALARCRRSRRRSPRGRRRCGGRFPASLRRKRPSAGCYVALALGDAAEPPTAELEAERARPRRSPTATGPLLVLGAAGTGKTELLARPLRPPRRRRRRARAGARRSAPPGPTARRLRERAEALLDGPFEELWIGSWDALGERAAARALRGRRARPLLRRARAGRAAGDAARPARPSCRCAATRSAATRPACWPACWPGSTRLKADRVGPTSLEERVREREARRRRRGRPRGGSSASSSSPSSTPPTTGSSPRPAASTAATSSSPSTASSPSGPTSAAGSPPASST